MERIAAGDLLMGLLLLLVKRFSVADDGEMLLLLPLLNLIRPEGVLHRKKAAAAAILRYLWSSRRGWGRGNEKRWCVVVVAPGRREASERRECHVA